MNMRGTRWKWSCAVFERNISEWYRKRVGSHCSTGTRACEYRVGAIA